ncbi:MAG: phytanoyl-CoA dioxygenase family protein [Planctomycetaceae bacterium]
MSSRDVTPVDTHTLPNTLFSPTELVQFERDGYVVVRGMGGADICRRMLSATMEGVERLVEPIEYEADLNYPGAPASRSAQGGRTVRRLKQAHGRGPAFTEWLTSPGILHRMGQLLGPTVYVPLAHHNCIMTKAPAFSSDTGWHQDVRYWSFAQRELVNVWLALGPERLENGCLKVIPGTHRMTFQRSQFDDDLFFRDDLPENAPFIAQQVVVELDAGDVLFFHSRTLHAATRNRSERTKYSVVFTFRGPDSPPIPGSRSAALPELLLPPCIAE